MKNFVSKYMIYEDSSMTIFILLSPLILTFLSFALPFPLILFPCPQVLLILFWMNVLVDELTQKIDFETGLNITKLKRSLKVAMWIMIILSIQIYAYPLMYKSNPSYWVIILIQIITVIEFILMIFAYYIISHTSRFIGKLMFVLETQKTFDKQEYRSKNYKLMGRFFPFNYRKTHQKIQELLASP